jgi:hypothetical protein
MKEKETLSAPTILLLQKKGDDDRDTIAGEDGATARSVEMAAACFLRPTISGARSCPSLATATTAVEGRGRVVVDLGGGDDGGGPVVVRVYLGGGGGGRTATGRGEIEMSTAGEIDGINRTNMNSGGD